jgi:hypothetical protein
MKRPTAGYLRIDSMQSPEVNFEVALRHLMRQE